LPPKHETDQKPRPKGPKERELAVALTIAVITAAKPTGSLAEIEQTTLAVYERMVAAVTKPGASEPTSDE